MLELPVPHLWVPSVESSPLHICVPQLCPAPCLTETTTSIQVLGWPLQRVDSKDAIIYMPCKQIGRSFVS